MNIELKTQVDLYNRYETRRMKVVIEDEDFASLYINNELITEDADYLVLERVKQINHECGYDVFDD
jgi:hypothetical protein